jgi:PRTRC genetic system protein E
MPRLALECRHMDFGAQKPSIQGRKEYQVFTELKSLLKQRVVMITVSDIGEGLLRVNIIPRKLGDGGSEDNAALTTPLTATGKAEELDRDLPSQLAAFTESIAKSGSNLEEVKTQHTAAIKAVEAENKKRLDEKKKTNGSKATNVTQPKTSPSAAEFKDGKPVFGSKPPTTLTGESRNLFDASADASVAAVPAETPADSPASGVTAGAEPESESSSLLEEDT